MVETEKMIADPDTGRKVKTKVRTKLFEFYFYVFNSLMDNMRFITFVLFRLLMANFSYIVMSLVNTNIRFLNFGRWFREWKGQFSRYLKHNKLYIIQKLKSYIEKFGENKWSLLLREKKYCISKWFLPIRLILYQIQQMKVHYCLGMWQ